MLMLSHVEDQIFVRDDLDEITALHRRLKESGRFSKYTLMMAAAGKGSARAFAHLMTLGEDPLQADPNKMTAALYCAAMGNSVGLEFLLNQGERLDVRSDHDETLMNRACIARVGALQCCGLLLKRGCDPNEANSERQRPLHLLSQGRSFEPELAKLFIDAGAKVNARDSQGATPLVASISRRATDINMGLTLELLRHGAAFDEDSGQIENACIKAVEQQATDLLQFMHQEIADLKTVRVGEHRDKTLLHLAFKKDKPLACLALLDLGLDPLVWDRNKRNAFSGLGQGNESKRVYGSWALRNSAQKVIDELVERDELNIPQPHLKARRAWGAKP